ncbi:hypothetical protein EUTSA_v10019419mg [Eutrema salsugineum]|uniref:Uncharacterized protein n=1 Tax=Eutrema salsugineum TaxID=72664 RepID=V4JSG8_EUTSA|nr:hypothetical protein EUTSA_v10019419mg [Eutrema salsugineum]ESQ28225.1 hypothetical protein EUTSA_v10019419mg [Eutrema salsugineum]
MWIDDTCKERRQKQDSSRFRLYTNCSWTQTKEDHMIWIPMKNSELSERTER